MKMDLLPVPDAVYFRLSVAWRGKYIQLLADYVTPASTQRCDKKDGAVTTDRC